MLVAYNFTLGEGLRFCCHFEHSVVTYSKHDGKRTDSQTIVWKHYRRTQNAKLKDVTVKCRTHAIAINSNLVTLGGSSQFEVWIRTIAIDANRKQ